MIKYYVNEDKHTVVAKMEYENPSEMKQDVVKYATGAITRWMYSQGFCEYEYCIKDFFHSTNTIRLEHRCANTYHFALEVAKSEEFLTEMDYDKLPFVLERKAQRFASFRYKA